MKNQIDKKFKLVFIDELYKKINNKCVRCNSYEYPNEYYIDILGDKHVKCEKCRKLIKRRLFTEIYKKTNKKCQSCNSYKYPNEHYIDILGDNHVKCEKCRNTIKRKLFSEIYKKINKKCQSCNTYKYPNEHYINDNGDIVKKCEKCRNKLNSQDYKDKSNLRRRNRYKNDSVYRENILKQCTKYLNKPETKVKKQKYSVKYCSRPEYKENRRKKRIKNRDKINAQKRVSWHKHKDIINKNKRDLRASRTKEEKQIDSIKQKKKRLINWQQTLLDNIKGQDNKKLNNKKKENRIDKNTKCNLTKNDIIQMYQDNPNCYYCKISLTTPTEKLEPTKISFDRIDNTKGHIKSNIVVSCYFCNNAKSKVSIKYYQEFLKSILDDNYEFNHQNVPCSYDRKEKTLDNLAKRLIEHSINEEIPIKGPRKQLREKILNMLIKQNYKSSISGLTMKFSDIPYYSFQPSFDRIDNNKGYMWNNIQLVCLGENLGRNRMTLEEYNDHIKKLKEIYYKNNYCQSK